MAAQVFALQASAAMPAVNDTMHAIYQALQDPTMADFVLLKPHLAEDLSQCIMPEGAILSKTMDGGDGGRQGHRVYQAYAVDPAGGNNLGHLPHGRL